MELTEEQLYFAKVQFQNKVLFGNAQRYESLFVSLMTKVDEDFRPIKPQGRKGDQGNDGFIPEKGRYFQVYAPEKYDEKVADAVKKVKADFDRIIKNWNEDYPITDFRFVFNDKYNGAYPDIEHALTEIRKSHKLVTAKPFLAKDLEREFFKLSKTDIHDVLGGIIPRSDFIQDIDYAALTGVLQHLVDSRAPIRDATRNVVPGFEAKIKFNDVHRAAPFLITGNYQNSAVDDYFDMHGDYTRSFIRDYMARAYQVSRADSAVKTNTTKGDRTFFKLLDEITPDASAQVQDAAIVLIAYFFEKCDVFEEPI